MVAILTILFFILSLFALSGYFDNKGGEVSRLAYFLIGLILILICGLKTPGIDRDSLGYLAMIEYGTRSFMEPSFTIISFISKNIFTNPTVPFFLFYAILGVTLKMIAINKVSSFWMLSIVIYFSYSFILHDMTQIRVGVAAGFILLSLPPLYDRNFKKFFLFVALATFFHYSAVVVLILWVFKPNKINKLAYFLLPILGYIFVRYIGVGLVVSMVSYFPKAFRLRSFAYWNDFGTTLNIFNTWQLMRCGISIVFLLFANKLSAHNKYALLLIKFYILGTAIYVLLSVNPAFSGRFSDLLFVFDIISLPLLVYLFRYKIIGKIVVILIASSYLFMNLYYNKIIS